MLLDGSSSQLRRQVISNSIECKVGLGSWNHKTLVPETRFIAPPRQRLQRSANTENQLATNTRVRTMLALTTHCIISSPTYLIDMIQSTATGQTVSGGRSSLPDEPRILGLGGARSVRRALPFPSFSVLTTGHCNFTALRAQTAIEKPATPPELPFTSPPQSLTPSSPPFSVSVASQLAP